VKLFLVIALSSPAHGRSNLPAASPGYSPAPLRWMGEDDWFGYYG
jgi:hypothetical protein